MSFNETNGGYIDGECRIKKEYLISNKCSTRNGISACSHVVDVVVVSTTSDSGDPEGTSTGELVTSPETYSGDPMGYSTHAVANRDAKGRRTNKGGEREHCKIDASGAFPTFEGETNVFNNVVLSNIKGILRKNWAKRQRDGDDTDQNEHTTYDCGINMFHPDGRKKTEVEMAIEKREMREAKEREQAMSKEGKESPAHVTSPIASMATNKEIAAQESVPQKTSVEQRRANAANRDRLFRNKIILSPLTTVGNLPFRRICAEYGADNTMSEMAHVYKLNRTQRCEWSLLRRHEIEGTFGIQVAVSRSWDAIDFAKALEASGFSYDYIDINCGCPVDLIVQRGCGCGLWERKGRLRQVVQALTDYQSKPVTIKCRIGIDETDPQLHRQIGEYEEWGAQAVAIHGRSKKQRYTKLANWDYVERCAKLTNLPVIGNGDILSYDDVEDHRRQCPTVSSYMLGRGALIKPWLFKEIKEKRTIDYSSSERMDMLRKYCGYGLSHWGADEKGIAITRRFLLEWMSFLHRYVPVGCLEQNQQRINERPPAYVGRDALETLMISDSVSDWMKISEMLLGHAGDKFKFTPKHKSNSYALQSSSLFSNEGIDVMVEG